MDNFENLSNQGFRKKHPNPAMTGIDPARIAVKTARTAS
jgi:hypothetical protein